MRSRFAAATLAALVIAGCGGTAEAPPLESFYRLDVAEPPRSTAPLDGSMVVRRFTTDGTVGQRPIVYAEADSRHALHQYNYHFWVDAPARMVQELTVDMMRAARVAEPVVTPEVRLEPDYELTGKIKVLEHIRGDESRVIVGLGFALQRLSDGELLLVRDYVVERRAVDASVTEATRAANEALGEIYASFVADFDAR